MDKEIDYIYQTNAHINVCFYKVPSTFTDDLSCCSLEISKSFGMIERENGIIMRIVKMENVKFPIKKVVLHHHPNTFRQQIYILSVDNIAYLVDYSNFKVIQRWDEIRDVYLDDSNELGGRRICFESSTGDKIDLHENCQLNSLPSSKIKFEFIPALFSKLKSILTQEVLVKSERNHKEKFVKRMIASFKDQKQSFSQSEESENSTLNVVSGIHMRLLNETLVVCISVINKFQRSLIVDPELILIGWQNPALQRFRSRILRFDCESSLANVRVCGGSTDDTQFEVTSPFILKRNEKIFLATIFEAAFISETYNEELCLEGGGVSFKLRHREGISLEFSPFSISELRQDKIKNVSTNVILQHGGPGIPVDLVALMATCRPRSFFIKSLSSPLGHFDDLLLKEPKIHKIPYWSGHYCFEVSSDPVHLICFKCKSNTVDNIEVTVYIRNESQGTALFRLLKRILPNDVIFFARDSRFVEGLEHRYDLPSVLRRVVSNILEVYQANCSTDSVRETDKRLKLLQLPHFGSREQRKFPKISARSYIQWRKTLVHSLFSTERHFD